MYEHVNAGAPTCRGLWLYTIGSEEPRPVKVSSGGCGRLFMERESGGAKEVTRPDQSVGTWIGPVTLPEAHDET